MGDDYATRVEDLRARRKKNLAMGGAEKVAKQHERGKLTVRERIDLLFDTGTFVELGLLAQNRDGSDSAPADGNVIRASRDRIERVILQGAGPKHPNLARPKRRKVERGAVFGDGQVEGHR